METIRGIVVEVTDEQIVIMRLKDGTLHRIPRLPGHIPMIGKTATYRKDGQPLPDKQPLWFVRTMGRYLVWMTAGSLLMFLFVLGWNVLKKPASDPLAGVMVALDINPSLEIYADESLTVTGLHPLNSDARRLAEMLDYRNRSLVEFIEQILQACVQDKVIRRGDGDVIAVSVFVPSETLRESVKSQVQSSIRRFLDSRLIDAELYVHTSTEADVEEARRLQLSLNQYEWLNRLSGKGIEMDVQEVRQRSIQELILLDKQRKDQTQPEVPTDAESQSQSGGEAPKPEVKPDPESLQPTDQKILKPPAERKETRQPAKPEPPNRPTEQNQPKEPLERKEQEEPTPPKEPEQPNQPKSPTEPNDPKPPIKPQKPEEPVKPKPPTEPKQPEQRKDSPEQPKEPSLPRLA